MINATNNKSFGSVLTAIKEVRTRIDYILDEIYIFFYQPVLRIEDLTGYINIS